MCMATELYQIRGSLPEVLIWDQAAEFYRQTYPMLRFAFCLDKDTVVS